MFITKSTLHYIPVHYTTITTLYFTSFGNEDQEDDGSWWEGVGYTKK